MARARDPLLIGSALLLIGVALMALMPSRSWVGKPFAGFLVLENRIVASAGLAHWPATTGGVLYQKELISADGEPVVDARRLAESIAARPAGTPVRYVFRRDGVSREQVVPTRLFDELDWALLFGTMLLNGLALGGTALMIRYLRGSDQLANASFSILMVVGLFAVSALDLYGPYRLFRLHALCETFLFAGTMHMALVFPHPSRILTRHPRIVWVFYGAAGLLALANQTGLHDPEVYRATHQLAMSAFGAALIFLIGSQLRWYLKPPDIQARQRVKVLALGATASLSGPVVLSLSAAATGVETPVNAMAFTGIFYPIAVGYAVLRHNLLDVDVLLRNTLGYATLTVVATLAYLGLVQGIGLAFHGLPSGAPDPFAITFTMLFVILLIPLRERMQSLIDRVFFRTSYDFRRVVETASERLASESDLLVISRELIDAVREPLQPERIRLYVRRSLEEPLGGANIHPDDSALDEALADFTRRPGLPVDQPEGGLLVPFRSDGKLMAVLDLARPQSGRLYGADDRSLLMTLANQGALAIENALTLEGLRELNRDLEAKVEERTAELQEAHSQLVHRAKMASLGQLVAGIAHEINNPLNFIQGNLHCLRESVATLQEALASMERRIAADDGPLARRLARLRADHDLDGVLDDVRSAFEGCSEGVHRSTALVDDLRSFSRADSPTMTDTDLHAAIESSLNLLRGKLHGIEVVRDLAPIPNVRCIARQIDQVLVNLIANAADALDGDGRIEVRTRRDGPDAVVIEVLDDGPGIDPTHLDRIFDPFFTTKEVGKGTGLGLSISYGIIERHGGTIRATSEIGKGTAFTIYLPVGPREE